MYMKFYRDPKSGTILRQYGNPSTIEVFDKLTLNWREVSSDSPYRRELLAGSSTMTLVGITTEELVAIIEKLKAGHK